uniref:site-specific DNA-methyltransferase (adenine-specific) n=1 Tax=uncultured marine thaumarchaeote KM3_95_D02 TaxID=1456347 RepID=A0A075I4K1_9ARCH|nr:D12 class N6 adenine-specific DNA methyltransferase (dam) [uncultured marine thaumarchaeote KM3_95_D02]
MKTRSPLRYPGGKSRAVSQIVDKYIIPNIPKNKKVCSPFFGGGSIEIALAKLGYRVYGYDAFPPLVDFWQVLLKNPNKLANATEKNLKLVMQSLMRFRRDLERNLENIQKLQPRQNFTY